MVMSRPYKSQPGYDRGPSLPALLQSLAWLHDTYGMLDHCQRRYGEVFTLRLGKLGKVVVLTQPRQVQSFFAWGRKQADGSEAAEVFRPFVGDRSILLVAGDSHRSCRRQLYPALHGEPMAGVIAEARRQARERASGWRRGRVLGGLHEVRQVVLRTILAAIVGVPAPALDSWQRQLEALMGSWAVNLALFVPLQLPVGPWATLLRHTERLNARLYAHIAACRSGALAPSAPLAVLLQNDDDGWVRDQLMTLLIAGYDTTSSTLAWLLYYVAQLPEPRAAGAEEAQRTALIRETLRLRPVVPMVVRRLRASAAVEDMTLAAGTMVGASVYSVHQDSTLYPQPRRFMAQRFLQRSYRPHEFLPFGGGHRVCLGQSLGMEMMSAIAAELWQQHTLRPADERPERSVRRYGTLVPERGVRLVVR